MKFTFKANNLEKLLRLPLYAACYFVGHAIPRSRSIWIFGRTAGIGDGPLAVLEEIRGRSKGGVRCYWVCQDEKTADRARQLGIDPVMAGTLRAYWTTLRASVVIISIGLGDVVRAAVPGSFLVQLWHGTPLKKIGFDVPSSLNMGSGVVASAMGRLLRFGQERAYGSIKLLVAPSPDVAEIYSRSFKLPRRRIAVTGDPRCDVLVHRSRAEARKWLGEFWGQNLPKNVFMYAPTWREGGADPGIPTQAEWISINKFLEQSDAILILRSHPRGYGLEDVSVGSGRVKFLSAADMPDVNLALPAVDALISDYSAIIFDYSLLGRPIVFFAPDLESYSRERGLYYDYLEIAGREICRSWCDVLGTLNAVVAGGIDPSRANLLRDRFQTYSDGKSAVRVVDEIFKRIDS